LPPAETHNQPNRRVRTRTHGGVGGEGPRGLPLSRFLVNEAKGVIEATYADTALNLSTDHAIANDGLLEANGGDLIVDDAVTGAGSALITGGGVIAFGEAFDENVAFQGANAGALELTQAYEGVISGFSAGDTIDLVGLTSDYSPTIPGGPVPTSFTLAVAGNTATQTNTDGSELVSTFNIAGQPFASDAATYTASSQLVSELFYTPAGDVYYDYAGSASLADFATYQAALDVVPHGFKISDTAANVSANFDALNADANPAAITLTDAASVLTLTVAQALNDTAALHAITNASYHIDIVDTASDLEGLLSTQIATLASEGLTELTASDATLNYNGQLTAAIRAAGITVAAPANDKVIEAQASPLDNYSYFFGPTGALAKFVTYHADKTSEIYYYTGGTYGGIAYVNYDAVLNAAGGREMVKFYSVNPSNPNGPLIVLVSLNRAYPVDADSITRKFCARKWVCAKPQAMFLRPPGC